MWHATPLEDVNITTHLVNVNGKVWTAFPN